jgi:hypothetical protein
MELVQEAKNSVSEWYGRDENKEYVYGGAFVLWVVFQILNNCLLAYVATRPDNTVLFLLYVICWYMPVTVTTSYAVLNSLRVLTLVQARRTQQLQGQTLETL